MTLTSKRLRPQLAALCSLSLSALAACSAVSQKAAAQNLVEVQDDHVYHVVGRRFLGLVRTNPDWLDSYLDLTWPQPLTGLDAKRLQSKLLTTLAFSTVKIGYESLASDPQSYVMVVYVEERWTAIPIARAAYGGGTPLRVLGAYDTHAFGRLLTLGAESRQYGDAPPGFVAYAKSPRHDAGRYYLAAEAWRDFRRRSIYAQDDLAATAHAPLTKRGDELGTVSTSVTMGRLTLLRPMQSSWFPGASPSWKVGVDLFGVYEAPNVYEADPARQDQPPPAGLTSGKESHQYAKVMPALAYDDVEADILHFDGLKWNLRGGPLIAKLDKGVAAAGELEAFYFKQLHGSLNLALHGLVGATTYNSVYSQYWLGGLDTVRGLPDGALYGTKAAYVNTELRHTAKRWKYLWLQNLAFVDAGAASDSWAEATRHTRASAGVGLRLAVPQIYRLIVRIDYAWSIDGSGTQGVTAGFNQFIDPYRPL